MTVTAEDLGISYSHTGGDWRNRAACLGADPELFREQNHRRLVRIQHNLRLNPTIDEALQYCDRCPVRKECLDDALGETQYPVVGVVGGRHISWTQANANLAQARKRAGWTNNDRSMKGQHRVRAARQKRPVAHEGSDDER